MTLNLISLGILGLFILLGMLRGTRAGMLRLASLVLAYVAAFAASQLLATPVARALGLSEVFGALAAGAGGFLAAFVISSVASSLLLRSERRRARAQGGRSGADRIGGGFVGALEGGLIILLVSVLWGWLGVARELRTEPLASAEAAEGPSVPVVARISRSVIEGATEAAMGETPAAQVVASLATRPAQTLSGLQNVLDSPRVAALRDDPMFWQHVRTGAIDQALTRPSFRDLSDDASLRGQLFELGLIGEDARNEPSAFRATGRRVLEEVGPRLQAIQNDPELQALADDPEVQQALQAGDTVALLTHPGLRRLVDKVASSPTTSQP